VVLCFSCVTTGLSLGRNASTHALLDYISREKWIRWPQERRVSPFGQVSPVSAMSRTKPLVVCLGGRLGRCGRPSGFDVFPSCWTCLLLRKAWCLRWCRCWPSCWWVSWHFCGWTRWGRSRYSCRCL
jgi:hypothetical protein